MRLSLLHPDPARGPALVVTDVEAEVGTAVAALRPLLARLTGFAGWVDARGRVCVDDVPLADDHLVGQPPFVTGCTLRADPGPPAPASVVRHASRHVAITAGPDCGGLLALPDGAIVRVGWPGPDGDPVDLAVADPTLGRLDVRHRRGRVHVRPVGRRRWRRLRTTTARHVGATTLEVRDRTAAPRTGPEPADEPPAVTRSPPVASWLVPVAGSVALAAAVRQPALALVGLLGAAAAVVPAVVRRLRRRSAPPVDDGAPLADPAALLLATLDAVTSDADPRGLDLPWDAGGSLAVVGPRRLALPVARAAVLGALGTHLEPRLVVRSDRPQDWSWAAWAAAGTRLPPPDEEGSVLVADDPADAGALGRWRASAPAAHRVLLVVETARSVPAWCRSTVEVGRTTVRHRGDGGAASEQPRHAVSADWAQLQVRAAAAARAAGGGSMHEHVPASASLAALPELPGPSAAEVHAAWGQPRADLRAVLGAGPGGRTVTVDLCADGPHALVAGTTGAGKSELLTTIVLSLAARHPPERLALLLVDFKGGTGLGAVAGLPHVLEHVTDLDAAGAHRVLTGLRAELRRRERLLAAAGARDLRELDPGAPATPPRLLVVVDELRALTEDVPDAAPALARLAAQGRALGMHLVLATQRPAGAVGADLRANVTLRIALRVADRADSLDVIDAPDAALIDGRLPGRAWIRRGTQPLEAVQVARAVAASRTAPLRPARPWPPPPDDADWSPAPATDREADDLTAGWVAAMTEAADRSGRCASHGRTPWQPALPARVRLADVPSGDGIALALADVPDEQRRGAVCWQPAAGHLLVTGGPRSGRTTTLVTAGQGALAAGWRVHALGLPPASIAHLRALDEHGRLGSVLDLDDARAAARLLELLATGGDPSTPGHVLLVDRLELALDALGRIARGAGADRLVGLWRGGAARTPVVATTDASASAALHAGAFGHRLVLPLPDPALDALAGVPPALAGRRTVPGRAVHLSPTGAQLCQVALPDPGPGPLTGLPHPATRPLVVPVPAEAILPPDAAAAWSADRWWVPVGLGGDDAGVVGVDLGAGLLVAGPGGSGRSTALAVVGTVLARAGHRTLRLVDPTGGAPAPIAGVRDVDVADPLLEGTPAAGARPPVLLVDDLDELERSRPDVGDLLTGLLASGRCVLVASCGASSAGAAFRGVLPALSRLRRTLVLDPHDPASAELVGDRAPWLVDPRHRPPGRGVLVSGRTATVVQVYADPATRAAAGDAR